MRLLRLVTRGGTGLASPLTLLQIVRAFLPVAPALAVGRLMAVLFGARSGGPAAVTAALVAGLFLVDQLVWLLIAPVRTLVVRRIDGDVRARVRAVASGVSGLDVLESEAFQDRVSRAVDAGMGLGRDRSAGAAAAGQLELTLRMVSAISATVLLATFSFVFAAALLALALILRTILRRQWLRIIDTLDADTAGQRYEYHVSSQAVHGAANTQLGAPFGGVEPSLGQWQRLALARSLMREVAGNHRPLCVLLDEPTAALDPLAEHEMFQHFVDQVRAAVRQGAVTVLVAHRFTTVRMADRIVVLDGGRVVEQGSHAQLMAAGGGYADLYRQQERAYR
jgi:hypothetical protein